MLAPFNARNNMAWVAAIFALVLPVIKKQIRVLYVKVKQIVQTIPAILAVCVFFHISVR